MAIRIGCSLVVTSLRVALEEQLGLRLETQKMTREIIVVDQARKPTK
jgi:uncharacterized protein (TIGR03435 family)